jgi:hypothetical protein
MGSEPLGLIVIAVIMLAVLFGVLWDRGRKGDFDIGKRMRMRNEERKTLDKTLNAK